MRKPKPKKPRVNPFIWTPDMPSFSPDANPDDADWPKRSFDFPGVTNAEQMRNLIIAGGNTIEEFKTFPVYKWNVDKIPWLKDI